MRKRDAAAFETLEVRSRQEWRRWLSEHYDSQSEIWLIFSKQRSEPGVVTAFSYSDAVEEALCFGWIDSLVKRIDDVQYARKFTPRKADSKWSTINRRRYAELKSRGLLAAPGLERAPTKRSGDAPQPSSGSGIPSSIESRLKSDPRAWKFFEQLAPSYRRAYICWIEGAKREETREKRLREMLSLLAAGKKLGLK